MSFVKNIVFIHIHGDISVGIPSLIDTFNLQWDLDEEYHERERVRNIIASAWKELYDDGVSVNFGDECPDCLGIEEHKLSCPNYSTFYKEKK